MQATISLSDEDLVTCTDAEGFARRPNQDETREEFFKRTLCARIVDVIHTANYNVALAKINTDLAANKPTVSVE